MKIDEGSINHNAMRLIKQVAEPAWENIGNDKESLMRLAYIDGITDMANAMKEVLNAR